MKEKPGSGRGQTDGGEGEGRRWRGCKWRGGEQAARCGECEAEGGVRGSLRSQSLL